MTYLWTDGYPISVAVDGEGDPESLTWRGRVHGVYRVSLHWRVDEGWWYQRVRRDYFMVITDTGLLMTVYQDRLTAQWYIQRLYD